MVGDAVFLIKIDGRKDFVFQNDKFPGFEHPHNLFDYFQNKAIDSFSYWIFSFLHQEKKKSTIMWNAWVLWVFVFSHYPILFWKLKIIGSSTIPTSFKLVLFCQYEMTSIVTNSSIIDDLRAEIHLWFVCFPCKTLLKRLKLNEVDIYMFKVKV